MDNPYAVHRSSLPRHLGGPAGGMRVLPSEQGLPGKSRKGHSGGVRLCLCATAAANGPIVLPPDDT
jgi:hypothetical protein